MLKSVRASAVLVACCVAIACAAIFWRSTQASARTTTPDYHGVYVATRPLLTPRHVVPDTTYTNRSASGVYIELVWQRIEPQMGRYDFSSLDRELGRAQRAGKKVSLSIIAGGRSPPWLGAAGAKTLRFGIGRGKTNACTSVDIPLPWDTVYQDRYARVMRATADHIARAGASRAIRIVKLTGIGRITEEFRLPLSIGRQGACGEGDADQRWSAAGYRPDRLVTAWMTLARSVDAAFPGAMLALDVLDRNDLPRIDNAGRKTGYVDLKPRIVAAAIRAFPGRFAVQWNGLNPTGRVAAFPVQARRAGAAIGWQSNMFRGFEGAGCGPDRQRGGTACDIGTYRTLLTRGVTSGAAYLEIWPEDVPRFPGAVTEADRQLTGAGRTDQK